MTTPVGKGAAYILVHAVDMVRHRSLQILTVHYARGILK